MCYKVCNVEVETVACVLQDLSCGGRDCRVCVERAVVWEWGLLSKTVFSYSCCAEMEIVKYVLQ